MRRILVDWRYAAALRIGLICVIMALGLSACGQAKPLAEIEPDEMEPGPGLFTGKDGRYILYGKDYVE